MVPKHTCLAESANQSQPKVTSHCPLQQATVVATDVVVLQNVQSLRCKKSITNQKCKKTCFVRTPSKMLLAKIQLLPT